MALGITRWYLKTKFKEYVVKCNFWHLNGRVILHYERRIDWGGTIPNAENDTFIGNNLISILQGLNSVIK